MGIFMRYEPATMSIYLGYEPAAVYKKNNQV